ncbi:TolC family protein [Desulfuromonas soudanensis]|nr:TolC family protein [Desulfuromonas soudanensis]
MAAIQGNTAPSSPLTFEEALQKTLEQSPKLRIFSREVDARQAEIRQAGLRPNPELALEVENFAGSGSFSGTDSAETTVIISQLFELGGKRGHRQDLGRLERELAEGEYAVARAEVCAETRDRFVAVLAAQKRLALAEEQLDLSRKVLQTVEERIGAGETAALEGVRFQTLVAEGNLRRERALEELSVARLLLATGWGRDTVDFTSVRGTLEVDRALPDFPELAARLEESPVAALRQREARRAAGVLALERSRGIPDITLSLGARNDGDTGDNGAVAAIAFPLPIFDRNQGAVAAARSRRAKAEEAARGAQLRLAAELTAGLQKLRTAHGEAAILRDEILPAARNIFDAVTFGYQAGKFGFLEVLDAERTLFAAKSRYIDALCAYHGAVSELERLLGDKLWAQDDLLAFTENKRGQS